MTLINPLALLGLLSLPIIVGLHLHLERNRRVIVSSMFLWSFLDAKFEGEKPKFIQISWLLLLDIAIASLLSLAFAQPVIRLPSLNKQMVQRVILIDDSTSMLAEDGDPDRLSLAKELAIGLIEELEGNGEIIVITFGGTPGLLGTTYQMSEEELIRGVKDITAAKTGEDLRGGLAVAQSATSFELPLEVFVLTDAAYSAPVIEDFPISIRWVFIGFDQNNQTIIDPVLKETGSKAELFFRVVNYSKVDVERDLEIQVNQQVIHEQSVTMPPESVQPYMISFSGDVATVEIDLKGLDKLPLDDHVVLSNQKDQHVRVALVTEFPEPIDRAIAAIPGTELNIINPNEYSGNLGFDLVIFRGYIPKNWPSGTGVLFDPPEGNSEIEVIGLEKTSAPLEIIPHEVLEGVDLTGVRWEYVWSISKDFEGEQLVGAGEMPFLLKMNSIESDMFVFLPQLASGNFTKHPAFPLFLASLVDYSRGFSPKPNYLLGESIQIDHNQDQNMFKLKSPVSGEKAYQQKSNILLDQPGLYSLDLIDLNGEMQQYYFGVNAGDFNESNIKPNDWRLKYAERNIANDERVQTIEVKLQSWLLLLVIALLVLEAWRAWR